MGEYGTLYDQLKIINEIPIYEGRKFIGTLRRTPIDEVSNPQHLQTISRQKGKKPFNIIEFVPALDEEGKPVENKIINPKASLTIGINNQLPPFFANLLPEGPRIVRIEEALGIRSDPEITTDQKSMQSIATDRPYLRDDFSVFAAIGADCIGDICGAGIANGSKVKAELADELDESPIIVVDGSKTLEELIAEKLDFQLGVSLAGAQPKLSTYSGTTHLHIFSPGSSTTTREAFYIVKTENERFPNLIENERFFMELASQKGIDLTTPNVMQVGLSDGKQVLLIERFDRVPIIDEQERRVRKIHVEDGAQVMGLQNGDDNKYRVSTEQLSNALMNSVSPEARAGAARTIFKSVAYSYLIGNGDMHAKNLSVWNNPETGRTEMTPSYDLVSTMFYRYKSGGNSFDKAMALPLGGSKDNLTPKYFRQLGERLGIDKAEVDKILGTMARVVDSKIGELRLPDVPEANYTQAMDYLSKRRQPFMELGLEQAKPGAIPLPDL